MNRPEMRPELRERLLEAVLRELGEKGREGMSVTAVLAGLGVSRREFDAEFDDLDACVDAAYEELTSRIAAAVRDGCAGSSQSGSERAWPDRVRGGLEALLAELAADPLRARTLTRTYPALGPRGQARYQSFLDSFVPMLAPGREVSEVSRELPAIVESLAIGAVEAILFEEIACGRAEQLPALLPSLLFSVLVPVLGPVAAATEMEKAQR